MACSKCISRKSNTLTNVACMLFVYDVRSQKSFENICLKSQRHSSSYGKNILRDDLIVKERLGAPR